MKKIFSILMIFTVALVGFSTSSLANENLSNAFVGRTTEMLPMEFIKGETDEKYISKYKPSEDEEEIYDFRRYFTITDQREPVLLMTNKVDGEPAPIDKGGYIWDLDDFDINVSKTYNIKLSYKGVNGVVVSATQRLKVIDEDTEAPVLYGISTEIIMDLGGDFDQQIRMIVVRDNTDGRIVLNRSHFEGIDGIDDAPLNSEFNAKLTVTDRSGNSTVEHILIRIVDISPPLIYGANSHMETKKNKPIDYKAGIYAVDNNTPQDEIILEFELVTDNEGKTPAESQEIDFNKVGVVYVKVVATDESGNSDSRIFQVIIKDSPSLFTVVLLVNASALVVGGAVIGIVYAVRRKPQIKDDNNEKE